MSVMGQNRRNGIRGANDRFLIHKRTFCTTASNDDTWPLLDTEGEKSVGLARVSTSDPV